MTFGGLPKLALLGSAVGTALTAASRCFPLSISRFWQVRWLNGTMRKHRSRQRQNRPLQVLLHPFQQSRLFRRDRKRCRLRQQRCLEVASRPAMLAWSMRRVGLIDITVGNAARL